MAAKLGCGNCETKHKLALVFYENPPRYGTKDRLRLTGNTAGARREYVCLDCGHTGWSASKSLKKG